MLCFARRARRVRKEPIPPLIPAPMSEIRLAPVPNDSGASTSRTCLHFGQSLGDHRGSLCSDLSRTLRIRRRASSSDWCLCNGSSSPVQSPGSSSIWRRCTRMSVLGLPCKRLTSSSDCARCGRGGCSPCMFSRSRQPSITFQTSSGSTTASTARDDASRLRSVRTRCSSLRHRLRRYGCESSSHRGPAGHQPRAGPVPRAHG